MSVRRPVYLVGYDRDAVVDIFVTGDRVAAWRHAADLARAHVARFWSDEDRAAHGAKIDAAYAEGNYREATELFNRLYDPQDVVHVVEREV